MIAASPTFDVLMRRCGPKGKRPTVLRLMSRTHLPALCRELGFTHGAEIGVWKGAYSATFCEAGMHMLCVDPWVCYPEWLDAKNAPNSPDDAWEIASKLLMPLNATIFRAFSADAAAVTPDGSLDFVYIDGNHVYDAVIEDLTLWAPKVRQGGIVAGHDYRVFTNKPTIHVVRAVQDFTKAHGIEQWFTTGADRTPSFLWITA